MIHTATMVTHDHTFHFASLDGDAFLSVSRLPQPGEEAELQRLMDGDTMRPMLITKRGIEHSAVTLVGKVEYGEV